MKRIEELETFRDRIELMKRLYLRREIEILSETKGDELRTVAVVAQLLRSGAKLRWAYHGWEIVDSGVRLPCSVVNRLCGLGHYTAEPDEEEPASTLVRDLLSEERGPNLDPYSRQRLLVIQNIGYYEYLDQLRALYREYSELRDEDVSYLEVAREKISFWRNFAGLYFAGVLHLFRMCDSYRVRLAERSDAAIRSMLA